MRGWRGGSARHSAQAITGPLATMPAISKGRVAVAASSSAAMAASIAACTAFSGAGTGRPARAEKRPQQRPEQRQPGRVRPGRDHRDLLRRHPRQHRPERRPRPQSAPGHQHQRLHRQRPGHGAAHPHATQRRKREDRPHPEAGDAFEEGAHRQRHGKEPGRAGRPRRGPRRGIAGDRGMEQQPARHHADRLQRQEQPAQHLAGKEAGQGRAGRQRDQRRRHRRRQPGQAGADRPRPAAAQQGQQQHQRQRLDRQGHAPALAVPPRAGDCAGA